MAWETRRGRGLYYTRSKKVNGKIVRQYVGVGSLAEMAAAADALRRAERKAQAEARRAEQAIWNAADGLLRQLEEGTDLLVQAALTAAGFHRHDRGEWRYKRNAQSNEPLGAGATGDGAHPADSRAGKAR